MADDVKYEIGYGYSQARPENLPAFLAQEAARVQDLKSQLTVNKAQAVLTFGLGAQRDIAAFADSLLNAVRVNYNENTGDILNNLVVKIKETGVESINEENFLQRLPVFGNLLNPFNKFIGRYEKISVQIAKITEELEAARMRLLRDITLLEKMYTKNQEYLNNLDLYIAAGSLMLKELTGPALLAEKAKAGQRSQTEDLQAYNDLTELIERLDKRLTELTVSRVIALQTGPQIRLIKSGNQALFEKIQSTIVNTIPLWKNQVAITITLFRQRKALALQKEIAVTTNQLLEANAVALKENTLGIAKENERSTVGIGTLKKVNNELIATIEAALQIQANGKAKCQQAEQALLQMESQLKEQLGGLQGNV